MKKLKSQRPSADQTRSAILKAARKLFAQHGFAGTSISALAKKAKINQSLIYHHFGSKEDLWRQTKAESLREDFQIDNLELLFDTSNLKNFLHDFVTKRFEFYEKNPDIRRMIFWQRLESNNELHGFDKGNKLYFETLRNAVINFQRNNQIKSDIDPEFILALLHTVCSNLIQDYAFFNNLSPQEKNSTKQRYKKFIINSLEKILT